VGGKRRNGTVINKKKKGGEKNSVKKGKAEKKRIGKYGGNS